MPCIYCLESADGPSPRSHIFPESIFGDHDELVLADGEVCGACNNGFAHLESEFKDRLGFVPMLVGPGVNKRGRPTTINAPGMRGTRNSDGPNVTFNLGKRPLVASDGKHVRPAPRRGERVEFRPGTRGPDGYRFSFEHEMRVDEVFVRILTKIAFETICLHRGPEYCADLRWHSVRAFVLRSEGERAYFMPKTLAMPTGPDGEVRIPVRITLRAVQVRTDGAQTEEWVAAIHVGPSFLLDLSPRNEVLPAILEGVPASVRDAGILRTCRGEQGARAS